MNIKRRLLGIVILCLVVPFILGVSLYANPGGTGPCTVLEPGNVCYYTFSDTTDSGIYDVRKCTNDVCYYFIGDGTAEFQPMSCTENDVAGDCGVFIDDINYDGVVDSLDAAINIDGTHGQQGVCMRPKTPWHWIDVKTAPASGTVDIAISCN